jgi:hypothetical protein
MNFKKLPLDLLVKVSWRKDKAFSSEKGKATGSGLFCAYAAGERN